jgi:hypothetical protein
VAVDRQAKLGICTACAGEFLLRAAPRKNRNASMTLRVKVNFKISCPKHRRYDPATDGEAGIKGGCPVCTALLALHNDAIQLIEKSGTCAAFVRTKTKAARA